MNFDFLRHPQVDSIADFRRGTLSPRDRRRIAKHLEECARCQDALRFMGRMNDALAESTATPPADMLDRILASRASGERHIIGTPELGARRKQSRIVAWGAAAAGTILAAILVVSRTADLAAVSTQSEMRILPAQPKLGDTIRVTYRPMTGMFVSAQHLVLRARMRTRDDAMYEERVPQQQIRAVATLERRRDGSFGGQFVLPDSIVYASLVAEDDSAARIDDNNGRNWEILTYAPDARPSFEALKERANDMMGRSWDEAYGSSLRLAKLYPDRVSALTLRTFFEQAIFGERFADSTRKTSGVMDSLIAALKTQPSVSEEDIGNVFYLFVRARKGVAADSAAFNYWRERTLREYPRHPQLAQYYAVSFSKDDWNRPAKMLDSLERLYARFAPLRGPGQNLANIAMQAASHTTNDSLQRVWRERQLAGAPDSAYRLAVVLAAHPAFRAEGEDALRALLRGSPERYSRTRSLVETRREYEERLATSRRRALVSLGTALIADGHTSAAIDTLGLAASGVWDADIFRSIRSAYLAAGDTGAADRIQVKLAVDPRTPPDSAREMTRTARARLGTAKWDSLTMAAHDEMRARYLDRSIVKSLHSAPHVLTADGKTVALRDVTQHKPALVVFWSRECGWALDALPAIARVASRLTEDGVPIVLVAGDRPSDQVTRFLAEKKWTFPVYFDSNGEMQAAFANFGTPEYYVLDGASRIRFDRVSNDIAELIAQVDALRP